MQAGPLAPWPTPTPSVLVGKMGHRNCAPLLWEGTTTIKYQEHASKPASKPTEPSPVCRQVGALGPGTLVTPICMGAGCVGVTEGPCPSLSPLGLLLPAPAEWGRGGRRGDPRDPGPSR